MRALESPSSINLYILCPRKYYYRYIENIVPPEDIFLIRGKIVHKVLEDIFNINEISDNYEFELKIIAIELFDKIWNENLQIINSLILNKEIIQTFYNESKEMLFNWAAYISKKIKESNLTPNEAFETLKGKREVDIISDKLGIRGVLDTVFDNKIMDYKTSSRDDITEEHKLQLGIYTILFQEKYQKPLSSASLFFLKFGEKEIKITEDLINEAKEKISFVKSKTQTAEKENYPKKQGPFCKWSSGQCPYFKLCFPEN